MFINSDSGEEYITVDGNQGDRNNLTAWHNGDNLVLAVAAQNENTIVVVHSVGPLIVEPWIEHPNITAVSELFLDSRDKKRNSYLINLFICLPIYLCSFLPPPPTCHPFLGRLGWTLRDRDRQCARRCALRRCKPVRSPSIHYCKRCQRL